ncbi:MAG TPA: TonB-dependent receptor [Bacteroidales bacterium]|nr:TonB-dependent receptor [Bacteroidales bacterium]
MRLFFIGTALFAGSIMNYISGQGVVKGRIIDAETKEPLTGVYVIHGINEGTVSDDNGSFSFQASSGKASITFRFVGYKDITKSINVINGDTIQLPVQMETELREIGQIVVSANRSEQRISELSVSMDLLKPIDFSRSHITDTKELINKTSGIEVIDGQASIRGGTGFSYGVGSRVLALIDGLPAISPDAGNIKWQFLPLENISQVEIIKGASSVLYGSSALNGVINFRTASAGDDPDTRFFAEAGMFGKPGNLNWKWWNKPRVFSTLSFSQLQKTGRNDIGLGLNYTDDKGYRKFNGESLIRANLRVKHYSKIEGLEYGMNINSGYTDKTDFVLWENAETGALKQDTSSVAALHGIFYAFDPFISYKKRKLTNDIRFRLQSSENRFPVRSENNSEASSVYGEYQSAYSFSGQLSATAGVALNHSNIKSEFYGDHKGLNLAGFLQAEARPWQKVSISAGVRIEHNSLDGADDKTVPVFRSGVNWQLAQYTFLRGSFGQGYRYPSVAEKHASTTLGAVKIVPNPDIKAETGWSSELGLKQGLLLGNITGQADVAFFVSQNRDLIEYVFGYYQDILTGIYDFGFRASNVEQSGISGIETEIELTGTTGNLRYYINGGYTYINPVEINSTGKSSGKYLKYRRKHSLKLSVGADFYKLQAGFSLFYRSSILAIDDVFTNELTRERILPGFYDYWLKNNNGYFLIDGNIGINFTKNYSLSFVVKNITNTEYMGRPGDIQPQRSFSLRFEGKY